MVTTCFRFFLRTLVLFSLCVLSCLAPAYSHNEASLETILLERQQASKIVPKLPRATRRDNKGYLNKLYAFDYAPLSNRVPLILIPGRGEEHDQDAWWKRFREMSSDDPAFERRYKTYMFLYDSKETLSGQTNAFSSEFKQYFRLSKQPVILLTYSLGGVITREAFHDPIISQKVYRALSVSVPFHGSPIFNSTWFSHYLKPESHSIIRRTWDKLIYRWYILSKTNLIEGLQWDNFDRSKPQFEVNSNRHEPKIPTYQEANYVKAFKQKTIIYASYIENNYTNPPQGKTPWYRKAKVFPKAVLGSIFPYYGISEHAIMKYSNSLLANLATYTPKHPRGQKTHLYAYNDGAVPLSSLIYLPPKTSPYDGNLKSLTSAIDVPSVRLFKGLGHTDMGETGQEYEDLLTTDLLHPLEGTYTPNEWILRDLKALENKAENGLSQQFG